MKLLISTMVFFGFLCIAHAEETLTEKTQVTGKSIKRTAKKGLHRTKEALCGKLTGDTKVECLAKQAQNRMEEGQDVVQDKAVEIKNNIDSEKK